MAILTVSLCVMGCAFLPSGKNKLYVKPVKYVPCWENLGPKTSCGSVAASPDEAEGFIVIVGWKKFADITNQSGFTTIVNDETREKFIDFSVNEVISRGFCKEATVPKDKSVMGWEGSGDRGIYVVCTTQH